MQIDPLEARRPVLGAGRALPVLLALLGFGFPAPGGAETESRTILLAQTGDEAPPQTQSSGNNERPSGVEVMRVRGRGIAQIETEIPSSVTQFDAATIEALGAQDISDLSRVTPNVNIVQPGATQATFFVRGVGLQDFQSNAAGAVTIFQDNVSINAPAIQTGQLYDIENVNIVRGPQGTGPYRNASAGAIRVRSRRPTGNYTAQLRSSLGRNAAEGKGAIDGWIQDYEGAVEAPIVEGALSARFAFRFRDADPLFRNGCGGAPPFGQRKGVTHAVGNVQPGIEAKQKFSICNETSPEFMPTTAGGGGINQRGTTDRWISQIPVGLPSEIGDEHDWAARGVFRFQPPGTEMDFLLNLHGSRLDQDSSVGQALGTGRTQGVPGDLFGGLTLEGYFEPDLQKEFDKRCQLQGSNCSGSSTVVRRDHAKSVAEDRPLDRKPYRGDFNRVGTTQRDHWGGALSGEFEVFGLGVFALSSYDTYTRDRDPDTDFTPDILFETAEEDEAWQTYDELRINGELAAQPFAWELGGFYLQEVLDVTSITNAKLNSGFTRDYTQEIRSFGIWGLFAWDFLDDFTLEGGVRYNYEKKDFDFIRDEFINAANLDVPQAPPASETWKEPTGGITLRYHIDEAVSTYAKYTRGFKAGHFNALSSRDPRIEPAEPEINDSWEAGLAGHWFDRRLQASAAFFYYRYKNYQVFLFRDAPDTPPVLEVINAAEAEDFGIEVEARIEPLRGWVPRMIEGMVVSMNGSWLHGEFLDFQNVQTFQTANGPVPVPIDYSGNKLQNSPEFKFSGTLEWAWDFGRWGSLVPRYDINWSDDVFFDPNEGQGSVRLDGSPRLPEFAIGQPAFFLHNVRLAYRSPTGRVELALWIRNLTDEVYKNFAFDVSNFERVTLAFVGDPRRIGADLVITF